MSKERARPQARYALFFDLDLLHRGLARVEERGATRSVIFSPASRRTGWQGGERALLREVLDFREGVWHIWTGFDHVLFLLSLLLPAVLVREAGRCCRSPGSGRRCGRRS